MRAELKLHLFADSPQPAVDLLPKIRKTPNLSLSEVAFQLERLKEEGEVDGEVGGDYRLI